MTAIISLLVLCALIILNGFFTMSETALIACRRARLQPSADDGDGVAKKILRMMDNPTAALSTIQIGITIIGLVSGMIGETALAGPISTALEYLGVPSAVATGLALFLAVMLITYFSIVMGELFPKRLGQISPEDTSRKVVRPLEFLSFIMKPFVNLLTWSTNVMLTKVLKGNVIGPQVTEEEIHAMIEEGSESGVIDPQERDMVKNVFRLDDRQISSLMTPRSEIEWINLDDPQQVKIDKILNSHRSRLVVADGSLDTVKGICSTPMLMKQILHTGQPDFNSALTPVTYVPETLTGMELLDHFRKTDTPLSVVVNEYGEVQGIVTPRDVLEAIAGQFKPENTGDQWAIRRSDGSWLLDGIISTPDLKDRLGIREVPEEDEDRYSTLSGMVMLLLGRVPREGDSVDWADWKFEVVDMDERRIDKVLAIPLSGAKKTEEPEGSSAS